MNDTTPEVEALFRSMLLQRSGEERLRMACSMFDTAKALASASIRETQPDISDTDLRRALFLRFYGHEFSPAQRDRILAAISRAASSLKP